jgi:hypothetical protein
VDVSPVEKSFTELPVQPSVRTYDTRFRPSVAGVTLSGPPDLLDRITPAQIRVTGKVDDLLPAAGSRRVPLQVSLDVPPEQAARITIQVIRPYQVTAMLTDRKDNG